MTSDWQAQLREASRSSGRDGVEVLRGSAPSVLDANLANALTSLVLASFVTGAALFRGQVASGLFDLIASGLRVLAVAFWVRASWALLQSIRIWFADRVAPTSSLTLAEAGVLLRIGAEEHAVARADVLGIAVCEPLPSRTLAPRPAPLWLVLRPRDGAPRVLSVPPYFAPTTDVLKMRLERWFARSQQPPLELSSASVEDPEGRYQRAARGQAERSDVAVPEGRGYLLRAPYTALLGLLFALDVLRTAGPFRASVREPVLAASLLSVALLIGWVVWMRQRSKSRMGLGMLLTPGELLVRGPAGVVSLPWPQLSQLSVKTLPRWSPFVGPYATRVLNVTTQEQQHMVFDASFLGVPVEVVAELCRAYRAAALCNGTD